MTSSHRYKLRKAIPILLLLGLNWPQLFSQKVYYTNYTSKNGLISNKIYSLTEDRNGFVWISTDKGVSKFDGIGFTNYSSDNGLSDNDVLNTLEDSIGRIWFLNFSTPPGYFYKGKMYNSENDSFLALLKRNRQNGLTIYAVDVDSKQLYFRVAEKDKFAYVNIDTKRKIVVESYLGSGGVGPIYLKFGKKRITFFGGMNSLSIINNKEFYKRHSYCHFRGYCRSKGAMAFSEMEDKKSGWFNFEKQEIEQLMFDFGHSTNCSYTGDELYIADNKKITIIDKNNKILSAIPIDFELNGLLVLKNGDIICQSPTNGIYLIRKNTGLNLYHGTENNSTALKLFSEDNKLFIGTDGNGIYENNNEKNLRIDNEAMKFLRILGIGTLGEKLIIGSDHGVFSYQNQQFKKLSAGSVKDIEKTNENELLISTAGGAFLYRNDNEIEIQQLLSSRATAMYRINEKEIWIGQLQGLVRCKINNSKIIPEKIRTSTKIDASYINDIKQDKQSNVWIATNQSGLFFYSSNTGFIEVLTESSNMGVASRMCKNIFVDFNNTIWVANASGLGKVILNWVGKKPKFTIVNYSTIDGLPDIGVNDVVRHNGELIVASASGCFVFNPKMSEIFNSNTVLNAVLLNGHLYFGDLMNFSYKQNNLVFNISASFFSSGVEKYHYKYRIVGLSNVWLDIYSNQITVFDIAPGKYVLEVCAVGSNDQLGPLLKLNFNIRRAWFKSYWFISFCVLLLLAILYYFLLMEKRRIENLRNMTSMELKVLRGQMNPHFIFNSLNSIQQNLLLKDFETTSNYISKFAKLLRNNLHYSALEQINLKEEADFLCNYLDLEVYRFHDLFSYQLTFINIEAKEDIKLPAFMVQPLLENCIKHGFKFIKKDGILKVVFEQLSEDLLKISVTDNGVGLKSDFKIQKSTHSDESVGLSIINQRIELLKANAKNNSLSFKIQNNDNGIGTTAVLILPITTLE